MAAKVRPAASPVVAPPSGCPTEPALFGLSLLAPELQDIHRLFAQVRALKRVVVKAKPMGAPRQSRRDVWQPRDCVLRYRQLRDAIRAAAGQVDQQAGLIIAKFYVPMSDSWGEAKKRQMDGKPHQQPPDTDNLYKAFSDVLIEQDGVVFAVLASKAWCRAGAERIEATICSF